MTLDMRFDYAELLEPWNNLGLGETASGQVCPFCGGGDHREKSFSVTRKDSGSLVFICHRNKCQKAGAVSPTGVPLVQVYAKTKEHKVFEDSTCFLDEGQYKFFEEAYGLKSEEITKAGFLWVPSRNAVLQPVYGPDDTFRGQVVRRYSDKKINTYKADKHGRYPLLAWYKGPKGFDDNHVVVVEDQLSAIKFSRFHNSVALLGTALNNDFALEIMRWSKKQYFALDKDATTKSLAIAERWKALLDVVVIPCNRDPKYWEPCQLEKLSEKATPF